MKRRRWYLVEAWLPEPERRYVVSLRLAAKSGAARHVQLPVLSNGRVLELIDAEHPIDSFRLHGAEDDELAGVAVKARRIGRVERCYRMWYRFISAYTMLRPHERKQFGVRVRGALRNLEEAYGAACRLRFHRQPFEYSRWVAQFDRLSASDRRRISDRVATLGGLAHFRIVVYAELATREQIECTLRSIAEQLYPAAAIVIAGGPSCSDSLNRDSSQAGLQDADAWRRLCEHTVGPTVGHAWVMRLRAGDKLAPHALFWLASALDAAPQVRVAYSDDDAIDAAGNRRAPRFKPDWSIEHLRSTNYIGDAVVVRTDALSEAGGVTAEDCKFGLYDAVLRVVDSVEAPVLHVPAVLLHRGVPRTSEPSVAAWERTSVERHLGRRRISAMVADAHPFCRRVTYGFPKPAPRVSIIVPTRDQASVLRRCVETLFDRTSYSNFELIIVDNRTRQPEALDLLHTLSCRPGVRILRYRLPFNYSAINNLAVERATGDVLCLLNNDTEISTPDWLDEMVGHLLQPGVGVVGAKLLYPDGRVQHGGDAVGPGGCANHLHWRIAHDAPGYCNRAVVAQELSAVTGACLVTHRDLYRHLGGLDARWLRVAFNDVDYCLRVLKSGRRVIWTPYAQLYHHESLSRGRICDWRQRVREDMEVLVMRRRWADALANDPFYNPNLNYCMPDFTPGRTFRVDKPWLFPSRLDEAAVGSGEQG